jgi:L-fuconate dehydratase
VPKISAIDVFDLRFPTRTPMGSGAGAPGATRSVACVVLRTDTDLAGHGVTFITTRSVERCVGAARRVAASLVGRDVDDLAGEPGPTYRRLTATMASDGTVDRAAVAAVVNAFWDLMARRSGKPLWLLLSEMAPAALIAACDFRNLSDILTPDEAVDTLERLAASRAERIRHIRRVGYPAYTSDPGRLGHDNRTLRRLCRRAIAEGWDAIKVEVAGNEPGDTRRLAIARQELGRDGTLLLATHEKWETPQAIARITELSRFGPLRIDGLAGHDSVAGYATIRAVAAPAGVATGGHCDDPVVFKQMLRAGVLDYCQVDPCRLASVNETLPVLLMAAKFGVPVCHPTGNGPGEHVQHLALVDFVCVSGSLVGRLLEYADDLHEHFDDPVVLHGSWYRPPVEPGYSARMHPESIAAYRYPDGTYWRRAAAQR